jgi:hypothetical protein
MNLHVEPRIEPHAAPQEGQALLRFRMVVHGPAPGGDGRHDLEVLALRVPGRWRRLDRARSLGGGAYGASFPVPGDGEYHLFFARPSRREGYNRFPHMVVYVAGTEIRAFPSRPHPGNRALLC